MGAMPALPGTWSVFVAHERIVFRVSVRGDKKGALSSSEGAARSAG
jgi:hypothetical protein